MKTLHRSSTSITGVPDGPLSPQMWVPNEKWTPKSNKFLEKSKRYEVEGLFCFLLNSTEKGNGVSASGLLSQG